MIRELLQTVGDPDVFFAHTEKANNYAIYYVTEMEQYKLLMQSKAYRSMSMAFIELSYGQTRDFINAVADELGEPL